MKKEARFLYEESQWHSADPGRQRRWYEALEKAATESVKIRLAQNDAGSPGSIAIGVETNITKGFVEEWLAWHEQQKSLREENFRRKQVFWTRLAALAATLAGLAAAVGWAVTILTRK
ncbi:MAG TPA: hypothetical protein VIG34_03420 [Xanthobacteraceae bacterium]|jgi:hypothetical protein